MPSRNRERDPDRNKGAVEQDKPGERGNTSLQGQLGHRNKGPLVDNADTDFPEPGENPEHSGQPEERGPARKTKDVNKNK